MDLQILSGHFIGAGIGWDRWENVGGIFWDGFLGWIFQFDFGLNPLGFVGIENPCDLCGGFLGWIFQFDFGCDLCGGQPTAHPPSGACGASMCST